MALAGYGLVLPAFASVGATRRLLERLGSTPPPLALVPWFAAAIALLYWYPIDFTGEWVEALAGTLFLAAAPLSFRGFVGALAGTLVAALVMTQVSATQRAGDPALITCASAEARALLSAVVDSNGATEDLRRGGSVHKRVWTSVQEEYLDESVLGSFDAVSCRGEQPGDQASRRRYAVDPWGTAYWMYTLSERDGVRPVGIYSFGPNRRRDGEPGIGAGDDVTAATELQVR
jgi:hypothetical protein